MEQRFKMVRGFSDAAHADNYEAPAAAGCLILAKDTKKIMLSQRGLLGDFPMFWATTGGVLEKGEGPRTACRREVKEETGYDGEIKLIPLMVYGESAKDFRYFNFLAIVPWQFKPVKCDENNKLEWFTYGDWPEPRHPGFQKLLDNHVSMSRVMSHVYDLPRHDGEYS